MNFAPSPAPPNAARTASLLDAAIAVFARFGYRKTSMDDVARAAGVSRQGLYLQFENKEELFRRALDHSLHGQLAAAITALSPADATVETRLIAACEAWSGRFIGALGPDAGDLMCAGTTLAGGALAEYGRRFERALADAIVASALAAHCTAAALQIEDLAGALHATARGLKQSCKSREDFSRGITAAVRMICAPIRSPTGNEA